MCFIQHIVAIAQMSESNVIRKPKYDGRSKKRKWEERRTDKGSAFDGKRVKENVEENGENLEAPLEKVKRRKYVLLLGYSGQNYFGMQRFKFSSLKLLILIKHINCFVEIQKLKPSKKNYSLPC